MPSSQILGYREIRKQRLEITPNSVSEQTDTDTPHMREQPESDQHNAAADAVSKAEEALDQLVSRHPGTVKVRHRDKALRALDYAGVSRFACSTSTPASMSLVDLS